MNAAEKINTAKRGVIVELVSVCLCVPVKSMRNRRGLRQCSYILNKYNINFYV